MKRDRIALKPYLDTIAEYCDTLSNEELADIIIGFAKDVPTAGRVEFLDEFKSLLPGSKRRSRKKPKANQVEQALNDIEALKESVTERIESIEDGSYWDDPDSWDHDGYYDGYDDEDPEYVSDDQAGDLASFFKIAADTFMDDNLRDAQRIYEALFALIKDIGDHEYLSPGFEFDIREARARYCRCVYETSDKATRVDEFVSAMEIDLYSSYDAREFNEDYPLLQDVVDAKPGKMADMKSFLPAWQRVLTKQGLKTRPAVLLLEATNQLEKIDGVAKLARKWKDSQPHGYLYWLNLLKAKSDCKRIITVCKEGFKVLKKGRYREQVAEFLIDAATELKDTQTVLLGKRERFFSYANDRNLLALVDEAIIQNARDAELTAAVQFLRAAKDEDQNALYVKALLMSGKLNDAYGKAKKEKSVGWSYGSNAGVVFGSILSMLADFSEETETIATVLKAYANQTTIYSGRIVVEDGATATFNEQIIKGLQQKRTANPKKAEYLAWAEKIGKSRIDHIVSNKHRGAYERAAQVLGALAEVYAAMGQENKAQKILRKYYTEKYNRFSAFRREVNIVVKGSTLLKKMNY